MPLLRWAEALDMGDGASGLLVPRAAPQERRSVHGPSWWGWEEGLGVCSPRSRADGEGMSTLPFIIKKTV